MSTLPRLQVISEPSQISWEESPIDMHALHVETNLHVQRRGSLPVNAFPCTGFSSNSPPLVDPFDPFPRRASIGASLQRLANNPYAYLARAKNDAMFGLRSTASAHHRTLSRTSCHQRVSASMPYPDVRRASMGASRPSSSPPRHNIRPSLPDHNLYPPPSRIFSSLPPGPLPSPNFSFGAANTPPMASVSSGDSERNSPDPLRSFPYRDTEQDDEDGTPASYYSPSRSGSITSVTTSDSSINSSYYPEVIGCYPDNDYDHNGRRDSW